VSVLYDVRAVPMNCTRAGNDPEPMALSIVVISRTSLKICVSIEARFETCMIDWTRMPDRSGRSPPNRSARAHSVRVMSPVRAAHASAPERMRRRVIVFMAQAFR
jgi:hypothetical protein